MRCATFICVTLLTCVMQLLHICFRTSLWSNLAALYVHMHIQTNNVPCTCMTCLIYRCDMAHSHVVGYIWTNHILQHTATHCNTLQHTATHCNTLHNTATRCSTLQHTATDVPDLQLRHDSFIYYLFNSCCIVMIESGTAILPVCCSVLQCVAVYCNVLQCVAVCCSVLQCVAVCCSVLQCVAVCCSVL